MDTSSDGDGGSPVVDVRNVSVVLHQMSPQLVQQHQASNPGSPAPGPSWMPSPARSVFIVPASVGAGGSIRSPTAAHNSDRPVQVSVRLWFEVAF